VAEERSLNRAPQPSIQQPQTNKIPTIEELRAQLVDINRRLTALEEARR